uniref:Triadin n=1 Tax=Acanthochromis polyacanthus TaxID=80966 RepID=A0A3Q1EGN1_9TELE
VCFFSGAKSASATAASGSNGAAAPQPGFLRSGALSLLNKLKVSVELLIALAALLSWVVVGVVMFDFVEYKAVPGRSQTPRNVSLQDFQIHAGLKTFLQSFSDIQQIITDPVKAVNDAVDEATSLLNKFQGSDVQDAEEDEGIHTISFL